MKRTVKKILSFAVVLFASSALYAQFTFDGEIRPRTEYRHGFKTLADPDMKSAFFTDQRTRLNLGYKNENIRTFIQLQDVRVWGSQAQLVGNEDFGVSIHQAWGEAVFNKKLSFKFGRQELIYDDHRIFGNVGWAQQARSHDAALVKYQDSTLTVHFGAAYNQDKAGLSGTSASNGNYKAFQYLWLHKDLDKLGISFLALNTGFQVNGVDSKGAPSYWDNYVLTAGTRTTYNTEKIGVAFNGYYQMGSTNTVPAKNVSAYLVGLDVTYKASKQISAVVGFEMQSGNSQTDTTASYAKTNHAFNPLFGTNHKFNGYMDYFYVGNHIGSTGLIDPYVKLNYKNDKFSLGADLHFFMTSADIWDTQAYVDDLVAGVANPEIKAMSPYLGTELDLSFGTKLTKGVSLKAGYSQMFASNTMAVLKGKYDSSGNPYTGGLNNWAYLMLIVKPNFIGG